MVLKRWFAGNMDFSIIHQGGSQGPWIIHLLPQTMVLKLWFAETMDHSIIHQGELGTSNETLPLLLNGFPSLIVLK